MAEQKYFPTKVLWIFLGAVAVYCIGRFTLTLPETASYAHETAKYGLNSFLIWSGFLVLFYTALRPHFSKNAFFWMIPFGMIALSLALYDNSFTTTISIIILPIIYFIFTTHTAHRAKRQHAWSIFAPVVVVLSSVQVLLSMFKIPQTLAHDLKNVRVRTSRNTIAQVVVGIIVLVLISFLIVIPLLSSVEPRFAEIFKEIIAFFDNFYLPESVIKFFKAVVYGLLFIGLAYYWRVYNRNFTTKEYNPQHESRAIVINIVLVGIIALYGLFLFIQLQNLFVGRLPIDFSQTEKIVKSGFWQLFMLTILNATLFGILYGRISSLTKKFLGIFNFASLFLVLSALYRVWLYVTNYGLSHEKFFAFYTALFCAVLFLGFIFLIVRRKTVMIRIFSLITIAALWGYAFAVILPIDRIVIGANLALTQQEDSRININELTSIIGADALPFVEKNLALIFTEGQKDIATAAQVYKEIIIDTENRDVITYDNDTESQKRQWVRLHNRYVQDEWLPWIEQQREFLAQKRGLQHSLNSLRYAEKVVIVDFEKPERLFHDPLNGLQLEHNHNVRISNESYHTYSQLSADHFKYVLTYEDEKMNEVCNKNARGELEYFSDACGAEHSVEIELTRFETNQGKEETINAIVKGPLTNHSNPFGKNRAEMYQYLEATPNHIQFDVRADVQFVGTAYPTGRCVGDNCADKNIDQEMKKSINNITVIGDRQILYIEPTTQTALLQREDYEWDRALEKNIVQTELVRALQSLKFVDTENVMSEDF